MNMFSSESSVGGSDFVSAPFVNNRRQEELTRKLAGEASSRPVVEVVPVPDWDPDELVTDVDPSTGVAHYANGTDSAHWIANPRHVDDHNSMDYV